MSIGFAKDYCCSTLYTLRSILSRFVVIVIAVFHLGTKRGEQAGKKDTTQSDTKWLRRKKEEIYIQ